MPRSILASTDTGNRLDHLKNLICDEISCDIVAITESHLVTDTDFVFYDYEILRRDRNRHGGGVILMIRNGLGYRRRTDLESIHMECVWSEIHTQKGVTLFGVCYRPPGQSAEKRRNFLTALNNLSKIYIIITRFQM